MATNEPVNVICMKWGTKFPALYVNRLHSMVSRHLKRPHRFVCFTDDPTGLHSAIEALPLPPMDLPPGKERGWRKLSTFQSPLADLTGPRTMRAFPTEIYEFHKEPSGFSFQSG